MKFNTESMFCNISSRTKISNHTSTLSTFITLIVLEFKSTRTKGPMEGRGREGREETVKFLSNSFDREN